METGEEGQGAPSVVDLVLQTTQGSVHSLPIHTKEKKNGFKYLDKGRDKNLLEIICSSKLFEFL